MKDRTSELQGKHLHFEPLSGIAGDMTVAALVDLGVPRKIVTVAVAAMGVKGLTTAFEARKRGAFMGLGFVVNWPGKAGAKAGGKKSGRSAAHKHAHTHDHTHDHAHDDAHDHDHAHAHEHHHDHDHHHAHDHDHDHHHGHDHHSAHHHRDYAQIRKLLKKADLPGDVGKLAGDVFERIAVVEAAMHGTTVDAVTFHEVGAYDSIADIVGASAALAWLQPASVTSVPPVLGTGTVRTDHGPVPVPAPATAALLMGIPVVSEGHGELTTPTGAALLAAVVDRFTPPPPMRLLSAGYGAGTRQMQDRANVLRVLLGDPVGLALAPSSEDVVVLTANIDDMNPQLVGPLFDALFAAGALDVWSTPILMKKSRPALAVAAMLPADHLPAVQQAFFSNSTTLGLRIQRVQRAVLPRAMAQVTTPFGAVAVKMADRGGGNITSTPEFDDCARLAGKAGVPVTQVLHAANTAALVPAGSARKQIAKRSANKRSGKRK